MQQIRLDWSTIFQIKATKDKPLQSLLHSIFQEKLGTYKGNKVKIHVDSSVAPKFCKAQPLPYAIKEMVEKELQ